MNLIRLAIERPIAVIAAVLMIVMFGFVALQTIPIQLTPDINRPVISISTFWPGAAPAEVEREIVNRQEEVLRGLEGLESMDATASNSSGTVTLTFNISTNMDRALLLVANRLDRVSGYPDEVDQPVITTADADDNAIAWYVLTRQPGNETPISEYGLFVENVIQDRLQRVPGVAAVNFFGGTEPEMQIVIDPERMARYRLTVPQMVAALRAANVSVSAGNVEEGKRSYLIRMEGEFTRLDQVEAILLRSEADPATGAVGRVTVGDVATVQFGYSEPGAAIRSMGEDTIAINAQRETGANVIEVMEQLNIAVDELNAFAIPAEGLELRQVYDETIYINSAISLVQQNIIVGGLLAAAMLLLFLRSGRATLVVSLAIPVSVIGSFVAMAALGRSLNVVSLAGIAFAVGMVVDAAIVVLENIFRLRQSGMSAREAAYKGATQVWGAVFVSALTTVMVFIPILIMELEIGQLFRDIAVAISVSVLLSLLVAITVIPALSSRLLNRPGVGDQSKSLRLPIIDWFARGFATGTIAFTRAVVRSRVAALSLVAVVCTIAVAATIAFLPKLEYLPQGDRNFVFGLIVPPPGYNLETATEIAANVEAQVDDLWLRPGEERVQDPDAPPLMDNFFFVALENNSFVGATAVDETRAGELIPIIQQPIFSEPGTFGIVSQFSLFGRGLGGSRSIDVDISGGNLEEVLGVALQVTGAVAGEFPTEAGNQFRPIPGLELGAPEVRVLPDPVRLADNGVTAAELGASVDAFNGGLRVAEITVDGERIDLMLQGPVDQITQTQGIAAIPVVTRDGAIVSVESLANVINTAGPTEIRHVERVRTITLLVVPAPGIPLEAAMERIENNVLAPLRDQGLPPGVRINLSGTADELTKTWEAMVLDLLLALVIVYLVMAVLFESFYYPLIIMVAVPVAAAGGVGGLAVLNMFINQPLDMLTLLGFVILIGIVVNNAILLVHQSLYHYRQEGMAVVDAITEATRNRIRPIFMSTLTSIFGMLPLVVFPGAGSELYRGLGSVVLGGLALSALLTLLIVPPLLAVFMGLIERPKSPEAAKEASEKAVQQPAE
ncbi:MAG: efflux RND transporter permease subunit [Pseudomonadota bacterium]